MVCADVCQYILLNVEVSEGSTVQHAIGRSSVLARCLKVNLKENKFGIHGKMAKASSSPGGPLSTRRVATR